MSFLFGRAVIRDPEGFTPPNSPRVSRIGYGKVAELRLRALAATISQMRVNDCPYLAFIHGSSGMKWMLQRENGTLIKPRMHLLNQDVRWICYRAYAWEPDRSDTYKVMKYHHESTCRHILFTTHRYEDMGASEIYCIGPEKLKCKRCAATGSISSGDQCLIKKCPECAGEGYRYPEYMARIS